MTTRRKHLKTLGASFAFPYLAKTSWAQTGPNQILSHASFGGAGMAGSDLAQIKSHPKVRVQAIAEIDPVRRGQCEQRFKDVKV